MARDLSERQWQLAGGNHTPARRRARVVLIASRFHEAITKALVQGAQETLAQCGISRSRVAHVWVPGAFEIPAAAALVATRLRPHAIVALGCVIKGETPQYAAIGQAVASGLTQVSVTTGVPVTFGVIVADSLAQARARAGGTVGNRGSEAARAAVELIDLLEQLPRK